MTTVIIEDNSVQSRSFAEYARPLPFAKVSEKKQSFEEACRECDAITVKTFTDELRRRIHKHFDVTTEITIYNVVGQVVMQNTPLTPLKGGTSSATTTDGRNSPLEGGRGVSEAPSPSERAGGEVVIDVSGLANGMYFLKIDNKVVKFVKE